MKKLIKKQKQKRAEHKGQALLLSLMLLTGQSAYAQNQVDDKVVVIPIFGDDIPAISHPVADPFTNSIGMQFNTLPAGSFTMGSPLGEPGRNDDGDLAETEHTVTLTKAFGMQVTEVTNGQWNAVILDPSVGGVNPSRSHDSTGNELDSQPVENVTWFEAVFFANELSSVEGRSACYTFSEPMGTPGSDLSIISVTPIANCTGYRLPTEAEWEYAARAGTTTAYANPIGFDSEITETESGFNANLHAMGWYNYNREMQNEVDPFFSFLTYEDGTKPVAKKAANAWGLYDMHGNVAEWNSDRFGPYSGSAETDPVGAATGTRRVLRGGAFGSRARAARSAHRNGTSPGVRSNFIGFRLVLTQVQ